jgi:integrase/recombinase XerC
VLRDFLRLILVTLFIEKKLLIANNYITSFLEYLLLERGYSKHTITAYRTDLIAFKDFCELVYDQEDLVAVNYQQIRNWVVGLVDSDISNKVLIEKLVH